MEFTRELFKEVCKNLVGYDAVCVHRESRGDNCRWQYTNGSICCNTILCTNLGYSATIGNNKYTPVESKVVLILSDEEFMRKFVATKKSRLLKAIRELKD